VIDPYEKFIKSMKKKPEKPIRNTKVYIFIKEKWVVCLTTWVRRKDKKREKRSFDAIRKRAFKPIERDEEDSKGLWRFNW
jgi:hypothetical protein